MKRLGYYLIASHVQKTNIGEFSYSKNICIGNIWSVAQLRTPEAMQLIGTNLKKYRSEKKLSQESLANLSGIDWSTISRIERGIVNTSISVIFALAQALKIKPSQLLD